ncbi:hypothetical protein CORC01_11847 [Colletotrichum orchidophilum]|uniref:Uncharacterized protein n=1 Tax=Colletotrichum orchidophilum TaxID=1209926 RepID=A0A1G4AUQ3_9PEZI|nr:uncharacterized protein CORC01_11847 [Colletotrichum orchidophilum]OHE92841.1 hypothetical protein CORC01_11847 [Colletotrichum orchidophilum]
MKIPTTASLFLVFALLFQGLATAWELPSFQVPLISSWLGSSNVAPRVPQFVLDTGHPWLMSHARELSNLPDPASFICTSAVGDGLPRDGDFDQGESANLRNGLEIPADLFHRLEINNNRAGVNRYGWKNAHDRLNEMRACPRALQEARHLTVDVWVYTGAGWETLDHIWDTLTAESTLPPKPVPMLFSEVMGKMENLSTIEWMIRGAGGNAAIGEAFINDGTRLPGVKQLATNVDAPWLIDVCPSLTSLKADRGRSGWLGTEAKANREEVWFAAAGRAQGLKKLHMGNLRWTGTMVDHVVKETPHIQELHIGTLWGDNISPEFPGNPGNRGNPGEMLRNLMKTFAALPNLMHLYLPWSAELDLGYDGGPWCGNAYMGEGGAEIWRNNMVRNIEATEKAGIIVQKVFPRLKGVHVGEFYGNFTTNAEGTGTIIWEWTRSMDEWLRENAHDEW